MLSLLLEAAQDKNRTNSTQTVCSICKSHVNLSIFMDLLDSCSVKMLDKDENETAKGDKRNSTTDHGNDEMNRLLDMFPHITKKRIEDLVKNNTSIEEEVEEVVDLLVNENPENITSERGNAGLIWINNLQDVWKQYSEGS